MVSDARAWWTNRRHDDEPPLPELELPGDPSWLDSEPEPAWSVSRDDPPVGSEDENPTAKIPGIEPPQAPGRVFRRLKPEDMNDEELHNFNIEFTLRLEVAEALAAQKAGEEPEEYRERFYVWKMIFQQAGLFFATIVLLIIPWLLFNSRAMTPEATAWTVGATLFIIAAAAWTCARITVVWKTTEVFSNVNQTGIWRPRNRWLFITRMKPAFGTVNILINDATQGWVASQLNLNCWRVNLESAADEENQDDPKLLRQMKKLKNMRWVRDGNLLDAKIVEVKQYLSRR